MKCCKCTMMCMCFGTGDVFCEGGRVFCGRVYFCPNPKCEAAITGGAPGSAYCLNGEEYTIWRDGASRPSFDLPVIGGWPRWTI